MKNILRTLIVGLSCSFYACGTINTYHYDRLEAAQISFPEVVRKVGVVNNMPLVKVTGQKLTDSEFVMEGDGKTMAETLAQQMAATRYFDEVIICDSALCKQEIMWNEYQKVEQEWQGNVLSMEQVNEWTDKLGVDMLFSVERVRIGLKEGMVQTEFMEQLPVIDGFITPVLRLYVPHRSKPFLTVTKTDSIYWYPYILQNVQELVREASDFAASIVMPLLLPYWKEVSRDYYDGGSVEMRDAGVYLREENWPEAYALWKKVYDSKKGKQKMKAAFNLALYHELQGEFKQAEDYLDEASRLAKPDSYDAKLIQAYRLQLDALNIKNQQLRIQMNRFDDKN